MKRDLRALLVLALPGVLLASCGGGATVSPTTPGALSGATRVVAIAAGVEHTCALVATGRVACWGGNFKGQLGDGAKEDRASPRALRDLDDVVEIAAGTWHTCARRRGGRVSCWGDGTYGQLGDGTTVERRLPADVSGLDDAIQLSAGGDHTCALRRGGTVVCWGRNVHGEIAKARAAGGNVPSPVDADVTAVAEVRAGGRFTCARLVSGEITCWSAATASGEQLPACTPLSTRPPIEHASGLAAGDLHACAIVAGSAQCWGDDRAEQVGTSAQSTREPCTVGERIASDVVELAAGTSHSCARTASGQVACWGSNQRGQLGGGTKHRSTGQPTPVPSLPDAVSLAASHDHTCAIRRNGEVWCWGSNQRGELGDGGSEPAVGEPVRVRGLP